MQMNKETNRAACKKCGYTGHLTFQCRNFLKVSSDTCVSTQSPRVTLLIFLFQVDPDREILLDVSSTSSDSDTAQYITPLQELRKTEVLEKTKELKKKKSSKDKKKKSRKRKPSTSSSTDSSDSSDSSSSEDEDDSEEDRRRRHKKSSSSSKHKRDPKKKRKKSKSSSSKSKKRSKGSDDDSSTD